MGSIKAKLLKFKIPLFESIENARGDIPFARWVFRACEESLKKQDISIDLEMRKNESATRKEFNKHIYYNNEMAMGSEKSRIEMEKILNKINQRFSTSLKISDFKDA